VSENAEEGGERMVHARRKLRMLGDVVYFPFSHGRPRNIPAFAQLKHRHNLAPTPPPGG